MNKRHLFVFLGILFSYGLCWEMKKAKLMTKWAEEVDPANPLPFYPRPQFVRAEWMNLNGIWEYEPGVSADDPIPSGKKLSSEILVPFPVESAISGVMEHHERIWYRTSFKLPSIWDLNVQNIILHFGAVDWESEVYINAKSVGIHKGGYDSFSYDITEFLNTGENELIVRVYDPTDKGKEYQARGKQVTNPSGIYYTPTTGIWQTVWIEPVPKKYIKKIKLTPNIDTKEIFGEIFVKGVDFPNHDIVIKEDGVVISNWRVGGNQFRFDIPEPKLWSHLNPFLYDIEITLLENNKQLDRIQSYFGMRKIEVKKDADNKNRIFLNDEFVFQIGPLDQGFWPDGLYTAPTDEALKWDLDQTKAFGFNMVRKHVKVEPARWYYWCDKMGLIVWQDMPSSSGKKTDASKTQFELELKNMIDSLYNSPSIVLWVVFNEGWGQYDTERLTKWTSEYDTSRIVICASGWFDKPAGDIIDFHNYPKPKAPSPSESRAAVNGEYGGIAYKLVNHIWEKKSWGYTEVYSSLELTNLYIEYSKMVKSFMASPGLSAAVYTQTTDVEVEINGLITYDRKIIKPLMQDICKINQALYLIKKDDRSLDGSEL